MKALFLAIGLLTFILFYGCFSSSKINNSKSPLHYQSKFVFFELPDGEKIIETDYVSFITKKEDGAYVERKFYGKVLVAEIEYANKELEIKNGTYNKYHTNGKLHIASNYKNDKIEGEVTNYRYTGQLKNITPYTSGKKNGKAYKYYQSGNVNTTYVFKDDKEIEPRVYFYENGAKKMTLTIAAEAFEKYGYKLNYEAYYSGKFELYDSIGNKLCNGIYKDNKLFDSTCDEKIIWKHALDPAIEEMPQFLGGDQELLKFLYSQIKYPAVAKSNDVQGLVVIGFVIEKDGTANDFKVWTGIDPSIAEEAIRVAKLMPNWIPGKINGKPVKVEYKLPVRFKLE